MPLAISPCPRATAGCLEVGDTRAGTLFGDEGFASLERAVPAPALAQVQAGGSSSGRLSHEMLQVCGSRWHQGPAESLVLLHLFRVFRLWLGFASTPVGP